MKKLQLYKLILRFINREVAIHDASVIEESRLAKRLNVKKKIKRNEKN